MANTEDLDAPNDQTTPYALTRGSPFSGSIGGADVADIITVDLVAGNSYTFRVTASTPTSDLADTLFSVLKPDLSAGLNQWNVQSDATTKTLTVIPAETGTHYLQHSIYGNSSANVDYSIELVEDIQNGRNTTASIAVGETVSSAWEYNSDEDWYKVDLELGYTYVAEITSTTVSYPPGVRMILRTEDVGRGYASNDTSSLDPLLMLIGANPNYEQTWISVESLGAGIGDYTMSLGREEINNASTRQSVEVGGTATGTLDYNFDEDWFVSVVRSDTAFLNRSFSF